MQEELRRHQHTLVIGGTGVIAFSLWSLIKGTIFSFLIKQPAEVAAITYDAIFVSEHVQLVVLLLVGLILAMILDFPLRLYVARTANAIGKGRRSSSFGFMAALVIITLTDLFEIVLGVMTFSLERGTFFNDIIAIVVDLTSFFILVRMLYAVHMIKKLS